MSARHFLDIRDHQPFSEVAYEAGGLIHELAASYPPSASSQALVDASRSANFIGYALEPFRSPEQLVADPLPAGTPRGGYDAAVTASTRLLAWIWKTAGGDASITAGFPASKGPFLVRE